MSAKQNRWVAVFVILLGIAMAAILMIRSAERSIDEPVGGAVSGTVTARVRSLSETGKARFISIILYKNGSPAVSYMAGAGTEEFDAMAAAMEKAELVEAQADESFADLLVVSFGRGDTLDVSYSSGRNLLMVEDQAFQPTANLQKIIEQVQSKSDI